MQYFVPKVSKTVCITDDLEIAIKFSLLFNQKNVYLPVIESPRITRPDASNEVIKITNALAQIQPTKVIYGKLKEEEKVLFKKRLPGKIVNNIETLEDLQELSGAKRSRDNGVLKWGLNNMGVGLLHAIKQKKLLEIEEEIIETNNLYEGDSGLLIIAEDRKDITSIIIANYAYAFGASLLLIDQVDDDVNRELNDQFFRLYNPGVNVSEELENIKDDILSLLPTIVTPKYFCITFFTSGVPFGFAFPELPCSHIFDYPMLGATLCNIIGIENNSNSEIKVNLLIDPGEFSDSESSYFFDAMKTKNVVVRKLVGKEATVNNAHLFLASFPADLILISSHSDEVRGDRITYRYSDREDKVRELVIDEAIGFGWDPVREKFYLSDFYRFVSLDGIDWLDKKKKSEYDIGWSIVDFTEIKLNRTQNNYEVKREKIGKVHSAMAYKMSDGVFIPVFHGIADETSPIFISNACSSWRKVSADVAFAGARAYIGPIRDILNAEAIEFIKILFNKHLSKPICIAIWRTQNEIYKKDFIRRPYLYAGAHFTRIKFGKISPFDYLRRRLLKSSADRGVKAYTSSEEDVKEYSERYALFLLDEYERLNELQK